MTSLAVENEIRRRAQQQLGQTHLAVDYYRIRRRFAFQLPVNSLELPDQQVPGVPVYPWGIWLAWAMEERILSLGWCAQWFRDGEYREAAARDLAALASWPVYRQYEFLDLGLAHNARILWTAARKWDWLSGELRSQVTAALRRIVDDGFPIHVKQYGEQATAAKILAGADPVRALHNVSLIGSLGVALAAAATASDMVSCARSHLLNQNLKAYLEALLTLRESGHTEGVSYDGYVMDLFCDWLTVLPGGERAALVADLRWSRYFDEALHLGAPGDMLQVAPIGDVEPKAKSYQVSSQIKMHALQQDFGAASKTRAWYLKQFELSQLKVDALVAWRNSPEPGAAEVPPALVGDAQYAVSLRTGWTARDTAVVVSASNCVLAHLPPSYGSLCIGTQGRWFIQTPGYQQYMPNSEREWTNGPTSRNTPLLGGQATSVKNGRVVETREDASGSEAIFDFSACYAANLKVNTAKRRVRLWEEDGDARVLVEDLVSVGQETVTEYVWHADAEAAWWVERGAAKVHLNGRTLWISSPQADIRFADVQRLRGSRGQMALVTTVKPEATADGGRVQWLFAFGERAPQKIGAME